MIAGTEDLLRRIHPDILCRQPMTQGLATVRYRDEFAHCRGREMRKEYTNNKNRVSWSFMKFSKCKWKNFWLMPIPVGYPSMGWYVRRDATNVTHGWKCSRC